MSFIKLLAPGAAAVVASDLGSGLIPVQLDFGGMPVRKYGAAVGGAYAARRFIGHKGGLVPALILGIGALTAADVKTSSLPSLVFPLGSMDAARPLAGGLASALLSKMGVGVPKEG